MPWDEAMLSLSAIRIGIKLCAEILGTTGLVKNA